MERPPIHPSTHLVAVVAMLAATTLPACGGDDDDTTYPWGSGGKAGMSGQSGSGGSGKDPGTEGGPCYGNGTCNAGLTCLSNLCVNAGTGGSGGGADAGIGGNAGSPGNGGAAGAAGSGGAAGNGGAASTTAYIQWALETAADDSHGYNNNIDHNLGNPDYDCGTFVYYSLVESDSSNASTSYFPTLMGELEAEGWTWLAYESLDLLKAGDILFRSTDADPQGHTEIYLGKYNGVESTVGAHNNQGNPEAGDQDGNEVSVRDFVNSNFNYVLRPPASLFISDN